MLGTSPYSNPTITSTIYEYRRRKPPDLAGLNIFCIDTLDLIAISVRGIRPPAQELPYTLCGIHCCLPFLCIGDRLCGTVRPVLRIEPLHDLRILPVNA